MSLLSSLQREGLNAAILNYLQTNGHKQAAEAFQKEADVNPSISTSSLDNTPNILERKWTSVVRLQRKVMDLEAQVANLKIEIESLPSSKHTNTADKLENWLPRLPEKYSLTGHRSPITSLSFHPQYNLLISGSEDCTIKLWDWETGEHETTFKGHTKPVLGVQFSPTTTSTSNPLIASCSSDLTVKVWSLTDGSSSNEYKNTKTFHGHDHSVSAIKFHPNGEYLLSCSRDQTIKIWELATGFCYKTLLGSTDWVRDIDLSEDGSRIISGGNERALRIWDFATGECKTVLEGHEHVVEVVHWVKGVNRAFLDELSGAKPAGSASSSSPAAKNAGLLRSNTRLRRESVQTIPQTNGISQHEYIITGGRDKNIKVWDAHGKLVKNLIGHDNWIRAIQVHPSGKYVISASDDKTIRCWDLSQGGRCTKVVESAHAHFISSLVWAPQARRMIDGQEKVDKNQLRCVLATGSVDLSVSDLKSLHQISNI